MLMGFNIQKVIMELELCHAPSLSSAGHLDVWLPFKAVCSLHTTEETDSSAMDPTLQSLSRTNKQTKSFPSSKKIDSYGPRHELIYIDINLLCELRQYCRLFAVLGCGNDLLPTSPRLTKALQPQGDLMMLRGMAGMHPGDCIPMQWGIRSHGHRARPWRVWYYPIHGALQQHSIAPFSSKLS